MSSVRRPLRRSFANKPQGTSTVELADDDNGYELQDSDVSYLTADDIAMIQHATTAGVDDVDYSEFYVDD